MLFFASANGIPVSTTHTITGGIVGVGSAQRLSAVRWGVARRVVWAWVLTIPRGGGRCGHVRSGLGGLMSRAIEKDYDSGSRRDKLPRPAVDVRFVSRSVDKRAAFVAAIVRAPRRPPRTAERR